MCVKKGDTEREGESEHLQDCVGCSSPLYPPALCHSASKPNNLRLTHKYTSIISSPVGKSLEKGNDCYL